MVSDIQAPILRPVSSLYTSGTVFVPPGRPPPVFYLSPFLGFLLADSFCSPISDLASASPVPPIFPQQLFHFIHSFIGQTVAETCWCACPQDPSDELEGGPSLWGEDWTISGSCSCPRQGAITELSLGLPEEPRVLQPCPGPLRPDAS